MSQLVNLEHIRLRPGMYIGSTDQYGIQQLVFEAIDNAVDQFLANKASRVNVRITGRSVIISDDGEGYPLGCLDSDGISIGLKYLTQHHDHNTADDHTPHVHANGIGCGLFVLNALTQRFELVAVRDGQMYYQSFTRGVPVSGIEQSATSRPSGTELTFELDEQIFGEQYIDQELLRKKLRRLSFLFPGLKVCFQDDIFESSKGLLDLIKVEMAIDDLPVFSISVYQDGTMISAAATGVTDQKTKIISFANAVPTLENSSHVNGLKDALSRTKWRPAGAAISVVLSNPKYSGPTRKVLDVPGLDRRISDLLTVAIQQFRDHCQDT